MTSEQLKEYALRFEAFAEGIKFGTNQLLQNMASDLAKQAKPVSNEEMQPETN